MSQRTSTPQLHSYQPEGLPSDHSESLTSVIQACHDKVQTFLAEDHPPDSFQAAAQRQTRLSLDVVAEALQKYSLDQLAMSYNGGKDCLVLLIIFLAGLHSILPLDEKQLPSIPSIYSRPEDSLPEMEDFVQKSSEIYHLHLTKYTMNEQTTLKSSFQDYLDRHKSVRAIFVGTRRTDPYCDKLGHFSQTDGGWPPFMRINPVVDWHYAEIWAFIRALGLEYCSLYDEGYTSIGSMSDTQPNPKLLFQGHHHGTTAGQHFKPAYELIDDADERLGRIKDKKK